MLTTLTLIVTATAIATVTATATASTKPGETDAVADQLIYLAICPSSRNSDPAFVLGLLHKKAIVGCSSGMYTPFFTNSLLSYFYIVVE